MKRVLKYVFLFIMIIPILVKASNFGEAKIISNNYQSKFLTPDRYLVSSTDYWGLDGNIRPVKISGFTKGGLITQKEIEITRKKSTNPMSFSYIYDGTKIWTIENKIVSEKFISGSNAKIKPTEYVKHGVTVSGIGTKEDPWIFLDSYKVTVRVKAHGKLQLGEDEPAVSKTKEVRSNEPVTFTIKPDSGWAYANHTCGSSAHVTDNILTFDSIVKDITCEVELVESRDSVTLPTPCFSVKTKFGTESRCFSDPVKNQFFYRYGLGYFNDKNLTVRVGKFTTKPARTGWTFDGYFVDETEFVSPSGVYETSYTLIDEHHKNIVAKGHANEYTITYDPDAPVGELNGAGTPSATVLYEHDLPDIIRPQRFGYVFEGYFTGKNGTGTQYYNADGSEAKIWEEPANTKLYAKWHICNIDHYCPGNNTEIHCPNGYGTDEEYGTVSCDQCKYWDTCKTGKNTCKYGCSTCYSSYKCNCIWTCQHVDPAEGCHIPKQECSTCSSSYSCNCSDCKTGKNTCVADWVYNTASCSTAETYTVLLRQDGATTQGASMYRATYYGSNIVVEPETFAIPTKDGYIFDGYYTQAGEGNGKKVVDISTPTTGRIIDLDIVNSGASKSGDAYVLYAHWTQCAKGYYCTGNVPYPCDAGTYQDETGKSTCKPCPVGTFADGKGSPLCEKCPFGTYQDEEGKTSCINCPAGQYQDEAGKTSCKKCVKGSKSNANEIFCTPCNNGKTNNSEGSSSCDKDCENNANVDSWETASWNSSNNKVSNNCTIKTCNTGYALVNNQCVDNTAPTCTVTKSNTGTTSGVTTTVTCSDIGSGCKSNNTTGETGVKASKTYTVYDNAGNSGTCKVTVTSSDCNPHDCNGYNCNPYDCKPYDCKPHDCNCGTCGGECTSYNCCPQAGYNTGECKGNLSSPIAGWSCYCGKHADTYDCCDTCYDTCYKTCYHTCYETCYDTCYK